MTTGTDDELLAQIIDELDRVLVCPVRALLGIDLAEALERRLHDRAGMLAAQLYDEDDGIVAETVIDLLGAIWPAGTPEKCGQPGWWQTPIGRAGARSLGHGEPESVTRSVAAAMLGVHPGTVARLTARGKLDQDPDGGVLRTSVMARLAR